MEVNTIDLEQKPGVEGADPDQFPTEPKKRSRKSFYLAGVVALLVAGLAGYFFYWQKTPEYSIGLIKEAVQKRDLVAFQKRVDIDSLYSRAFDDLVSDQMNTNKEMDQGMKAIAMGFAQLLKPAVVNTLKDATKRYVETGSIETTDKKNAAQSSGQADKMPPQLSTNELNKQAGVANSDFRGISYTKKDGKTAIIGLKIFEKQIGQEFVIDLKMRELDDGTWQIAEFSNLPEYLRKIETARKEKLARINQPIVKDIANAVSVGNVSTRAYPKDNWGFSYAMEVVIPLAFLDSRNVTAMAGDVYILGPDGSTLFTGAFSGKGTSTQGKTASLRYIYDLNPFISGQSTLIKTSHANLQKKAVIRKISFNDGKTVALYDELPAVQ